MKKFLLVAFVSLFAFGCNHTQEAQVAEGMGDVAAVFWVATDHPTPQEIQAVVLAINIVDAGVTTCTNSGSWYAKLMPIVDQKLPEALKKAGIPITTLPMAQLGIAAMLSGIDSAMAMHPAWNKDIDIAAKMIHAFDKGALNGLGRPSTDPAVVAAMQQRTLRAAMHR